MLIGIPDWLWTIIIGGVVLGLIKYVFYLRDRQTKIKDGQVENRFKSLEIWKNGLVDKGGVLTINKHSTLCGEVDNHMNECFTRLGVELKDSITQGFVSHRQWVEAKFETMDAKFEAIDDKIENKVLKGIRNLNGDGKVKVKLKKKK